MTWKVSTRPGGGFEKVAAKRVTFGDLQLQGLLNLSKLVCTRLSLHDELLGIRNYSSQLFFFLCSQSERG